MIKKEGWFKDWLTRGNYKFQYTVNGNEVWSNANNVTVWHPTLGVRFSYDIDFYKEHRGIELVIEDLKK